MRTQRMLALLIGAVLTCSALMQTSAQQATAQTASAHYFPETGHSVQAVFWQYWQVHGGLAQQGYPLSEEFAEVSDLDGKTYTVQYFERAVFEKHPEFAPPNDVLLSQLGTFQYRARYRDTGAPDQHPNTQNGVLFEQTNHYVGGVFLDYWKSHGGLAQQGYPISDEFTEVNSLDGKLYTVQYFERAVFELHPENQPPYNVLLSQLGTFQLKKKYPNQVPGGESQPQPTSVPAAPTLQPEPTRGQTGNCPPVADSRKSRISNTGPVAITSVQVSGDEYVVLTNRGGATVDISGWLLRDKNETAQLYVFPASTHLAAGQSIQIYTEPGHQYSFNSNTPIWNNCGDALELIDASGALVATYAYGTHLLP